MKNKRFIYIKIICSLIIFLFIYNCDEYDENDLFTLSMYDFSVQRNPYKNYYMGLVNINLDDNHHN